MTIAEKVERKMAALNHLMKTQVHLSLPSAVSESIDSLSIYWSHLSDADRDYVHCARDALNNKREWNV